MRIQCRQEDTILFILTATVLIDHWWTTVSQPKSLVYLVRCKKTTFKIHMLWKSYIQHSKCAQNWTRTISYTPSHENVLHRVATKAVTEDWRYVFCQHLWLVFDKLSNLLDIVLPEMNKPSSFTNAFGLILFSLHRFVFISGTDSRSNSDLLSNIELKRLNDSNVKISWFS